MTLDTKKEFHSKDLRKGRVSKADHCYLVTTITLGRKPDFLDFKAARILIRTLRDSDEKGSTSTIGFVVMPDHLHWLMTLRSSSNLSDVVGFVKGTSAYRVNKCSGSLKFRWQDGFHDHVLRRDENLAACMRYIIANPLRAGLVKTIADYPHWDCIYV